MCGKIDRDISLICSHVSSKGDAETVSAWGRILIEWHQLKTPTTKTLEDDYTKTVVTGVFDKVGAQ